MVMVVGIVPNLDWSYYRLHCFNNYYNNRRNNKERYKYKRKEEKMSWYYDYYIGKKVNDKIELIGPYDNEGKIHPIFERSRSFASSLKDRFYSYNGEELKDKLWSDLIKILPYRELPKTDFVKTGYFLVDDVEEYLKNGGDSYDLFYDRLDPQTYAEKLKTEIILGKPEPQKDEEGYEIEVHGCMDYMFFAYPDYNCEGYEALLIYNAVDAFGLYDTKDIVIVMCEG